MKTMSNLFGTPVFRLLGAMVWVSISVSVLNPVQVKAETSQDLAPKAEAEAQVEAQVEAETEAQVEAEVEAETEAQVEAVEARVEDDVKAQVEAGSLEQDTPPESMTAPDTTPTPLDPLPEPRPVHKSVLRYGTLFGVPLALVGYGRQMWGWGDTAKWRWGFEGWFGADTDLGGTDKLGHAHVHYIITRATNRILNYTDKDNPRNLIYAAAMAAVIGTGIEIGDAYTGYFGFSPEDLVADYVGIAMAILLESYPTMDAFVGFTAQYWPAKSFRSKGPDSLVEGILKVESDGSGWKHLLNFKLDGFHHLGYNMPWYTRMVQVNLGYFTRGFSNFDRRYYEEPNKVRSLYAGLSLDFQTLNRELLASRAPITASLAHEVLHYVHLPVGLNYDLALD